MYIIFGYQQGRPKVARTGSFADAMERMTGTKEWRPVGLLNVKGRSLISPRPGPDFLNLQDRAVLEDLFHIRRFLDLCRVNVDLWEREECQILQRHTKENLNLVWI